MSGADVIGAVRFLHGRYGCPPSCDDVRLELQVSLATVHRTVADLVGAGVLVRVGSGCRTGLAVVEVELSPDDRALVEQLRARSRALRLAIARELAELEQAVGL